jgi:predicted Holliday junction resolvase-like endonuclease
MVFAHGEDEKYPMKTLILLLVSCSGGAMVYVSYLRRRLNVALALLSEEKTRQRSLSASYGRITEQWFPLMEGYPYDSAGFRFLGTPVDGVQFEEDRIVFVEFKSHSSELSAQQKRLKKLVQAGKVSWEEFHFEA